MIQVFAFQSPAGSYHQCNRYHNFPTFLHNLKLGNCLFSENLFSAFLSPRFAKKCLIQKATHVKNQPDFAKNYDENRSKYPMFPHFSNVTYPSLTKGDFPAGRLKNVKILPIQFSKEQILPITMFTISQLIIYQDFPQNFQKLSKKKDKVSSSKQ